MIEAYACVERWARHFNASESDAVARLYVPDAVLWGTLSQDLTISPQDIKAYFTEAARAGLTVRLGAYIARSLSGNAAIIAGDYDLFRTLNGQSILFPARYSFVLIKHDTAWLIAHHHSSLKPGAGAAFNSAK